MRIEFLIFYLVCLFHFMKNGIHTYYIAWTLLIALLCDPISLFVHEMGHLFFGSLAGFKLFDLGIPFVIIQKQKNGWIICKNVNNKNYCFMKKKKRHVSKEGYIFYYCGGFWANYLVALVCLLLYKKYFLVMCGVAIYNLSTGIKNMIPNQRRKYSDGTVVTLIFSDSKTIDLISQQMCVQSNLLLVNSLAEISCISDTIKVKKENDLSLFSKIMKIYLCLEQKKLDECVRQIDYIENDILNYSFDMQKIYWCERLFIYSIIEHPDAKKIYEFYMSLKPEKTIDFYCSIYCYGIVEHVSGIEIDEIRIILQNYLVRNEGNVIANMKAHFLRFDNIK